MNLRMKNLEIKNGETNVASQNLNCKIRVYSSEIRNNNKKKDVNRDSHIASSPI